MDRGDQVRAWSMTESVRSSSLLALGQVKDTFREICIWDKDPGAGMHMPNKKQGRVRSGQAQGDTWIREGSGQIYTCTRVRAGLGRVQRDTWIRESQVRRRSVPGRHGYDSESNHESTQNQMLFA